MTSDIFLKEGKSSAWQKPVFMPERLCQHQFKLRFESKNYYAGNSPLSSYENGFTSSGIFFSTPLFEISFEIV